MALTKLGKYIKQSDDRNYDGIYGKDSVAGLSTQKQIIRTKADLTGVNLTSYKLVHQKYFAYDQILPRVETKSSSPII